MVNFFVMSVYLPFSNKLIENTVNLLTVNTYIKLDNKMLWYEKNAAMYQLYTYFLPTFVNCTNISRKIFPARIAQYFINNVCITV